MALTALEITKAACYEINAPAPASLFGSTDSYNLQLLNLFYSAGRELLSARAWPQLKRRHTIFLESQRSKYPLPVDFFAALTDTSYDANNTWQMQGPLSDSGFNLRQYGYTTSTTRKAYRVFGPDSNPNDSRGQLEIHPTPGDAEAGQTITFEYISKSWIFPPNWTASTSYANNVYVNSNGNIYKNATGGTLTSGTVSPSIAYGIGQDGGVFWRRLTTPAWGSGNSYTAGDYVVNSSKLYKCTVGGVSGVTGPTGTDTDTEETEGSVSWLYILPLSWTARTEYAPGVHLKVTSAYWINVTPHGETAKSGAVQPDWGPTTQSDGLLTWTWQNVSYEAILSDNDLCLFDDQVMISAVKWRLLRARGTEFRDIFDEYDTLKRAALNRWNNGKRISFGDSLSGSVGLYPNLPESFDL